MIIRIKSLFTVLFIISSASLFTSCFDFTSNMFLSHYVQPSVVVKDASDITENSATLNGTVQPNSVNVTVSFILYIGNLTSLQQDSTFQANPSYIPSGTAWTTVNTKVTGLTSKTTYSFSILIENGHLIFGKKSFTTL